MERSLTFHIWDIPEIKGYFFAKPQNAWKRREQCKNNKEILLRMSRQASAVHKVLFSLVLPFLVFPTEPLQSLEKKGKKAQKKGLPRTGEKQGTQKKQGKEGKGRVRD